MRVRLDSDRPEVVEAVRRAFAAAGVGGVDIDPEPWPRAPGWTRLLVDATQDPWPGTRYAGSPEGQREALAALERALARAVEPYGFDGVLLDVGPGAYERPDAPVRVQINLTAGPNEVRSIEELFRAHSLEVQVEPTFYNPHEFEVRAVTIVACAVELPAALRGALSELRGGGVTYVERLPS